VPEGGLRSRGKGGEQQRQTKEEPTERRGAHQDAEGEREPDRQFTIGYEESDGSGVREDEAAKNGRHEWIRPAFGEEFVNPELKSAMQSKLRAENLVFAKDQEQNAEADAKDGQGLSIATAGVRFRGRRAAR